MAKTICDVCAKRSFCVVKSEFYPVVKCGNYENINDTITIANGEKICDVDGIDEMADGRYVFDTDFYLDALDKKKPMTNGEWLNQASMRELIVFLILISVRNCTDVKRWLKEKHYEHTHTDDV